MPPAACTFRVANDVGKVEVREAVKALYGVVPRRVNMVSVRTASVRFGRTMGQRGAWQRPMCSSRRESTWMFTKACNMPIKRYNPTTNGRRKSSVQSFADVTTSTPLKALTKPRRSSRVARAARSRCAIKAAAPSRKRAWWISAETSLRSRPR